MGTGWVPAVSDELTHGESAPVGEFDTVEEAVVVFIKGLEDDTGIDGSETSHGVFVFVVVQTTFSSVQFDILRIVSITVSPLLFFNLVIMKMWSYLF